MMLNGKQKMNQKKIYPLALIGGHLQDEEAAYSKGGCCAWCAWSGCAVTSIAESLGVVAAHE